MPIKHVLNISLLLFLLCGSVSAQSGMGIQFFKGSLAEAQAKAAEEDKLIFVDTYASWCGPCKLMAREVFTDPKVGRYFNEHFINVKVDVDQASNYSFVTEMNIRSIPDLIFMDSEGNVIKRGRGYYPSKDFLKLAAKAEKRS